MQIITTKIELQQTVSEFKKNGKSIGFVPTMGALHEGHISLINCSTKGNDYTVSSLFVNPTQFNNPEDLKKYPRTFEQDKKMLEAAKCDILFMPEISEMYPEGDKKPFYDFGEIATVMEGRFRPGHFDGVAQIVGKLFELVRPTKAYFGQKDFQQLAIVNMLNDKYLSHLKIEVVPCKIIREKDGLAMSSRNLRLTKDQRKSATIISQTLFEIEKETRRKRIDELIKQAQEKISSDKNLKLEYLEIVDNKSLKSVSDWNESKNLTACIAVYNGTIRLIDNINLPSSDYLRYSGK